MIEVEKKFIFDENDKNRLVDEAEFLSEKIFIDTYYDTNDFALITKDKWLRSRDGKFELKLPVGLNTERLIDRYDELEDESEIKKALNLVSNKNLADDLEKNSYVPFCVCKTTRKKYKKDGFIIDLDVVDFEDFSYNIGEIELIVNDQSEVESAVNQIMSFAEKNNLKITYVRGKVVEYLKRQKPEQYQTLVKAEIAKDFD